MDITVRDFKPVAVVNAMGVSSVSYKAMHLRLGRSFGPASRYVCVGCGSPANEWSYTQDDPNEKVCPQRGLRYSVYPEYYTPRCRSCHHKTDRPRVMSRCTVDGCDRTGRYQNAMCNSHHTRVMRDGHPGPAEFAKAKGGRHGH